MKNTAATLMSQKQSGEKITMLTAYDYTTACIAHEYRVYPAQKPFRAALKTPL